MSDSPAFVAFPKMARLSREIVITEKIDGTNASILIDSASGEFRIGSRTRWIHPGDDNFGFAAWAMANRDELLTLGDGHHFGEWWGRGIQRNYSQTERIFSLFNVSRWGQERDREKFPNDAPACCRVVPVLFRGDMEQHGVMSGLKWAMKRLAEHGSVAAPGFMNPEGVVVFHSASGVMFKKTLEGDESPKSARVA